MIYIYNMYPCTEDYAFVMINSELYIECKQWILIERSLHMLTLTLTVYVIFALYVFEVVGDMRVPVVKHSTSQ